MKQVLTILFALLIAPLAATHAADVPPPLRGVCDLTPLHDATRVLINPHKGWYHHFPDNHPEKYAIARDADLLDFPGMDHLYIRLAWAYLEPKEGQFDWAVIDRIIEKWTAHGLGIAFRISCKETGTDRIEQQFATPRWVMEAGAQGGHYRMGKATGPEGPWEPAFDDPVFLAKLDRFLAAFAARYDAKPWLRYLDIGSIGDWGEGHCWAGSRKDMSFAVRKAHIDLHLKHFKHTQLIISDDYVHALKDPAERASLHQHILANGISYRDDSIMVDSYFAGTSDRFTVRSPEYFADAYPQTPTVFELEHYGTVKSRGNWAVLPDSSAAKFGKGKKGPDFFRGALELLHATYIGYHGYANEWLADNPDLTKELLNTCGYWLFPTTLELPDKPMAGATVPLSLTMENRGVAPPYAPYELRVKLSGMGTNWVHVAGRAEKSWLPGRPIVLRCELPLPAALQPGQYQVAIGLFDAVAAKERPVEFALKESARDPEGYYRVATLLVCAASMQASEVIVSAPDSPMLRYALAKLDVALQQHGDTLAKIPHHARNLTPKIAVIIDPVATATIGPDGFSRVRKPHGLEITACDERGALYGLLDVAQELRLGTPRDQILDRTVKPHLEFRAIKFNLPWSAYRTSPALEQHQKTCKDLRYWEAFLDMMVENRFNVLTLWSLHPYTYMIRPRNFPEACPFDDVELAEWKKLWSGIFAMAKQRGIETYLLNWNIFVSPEFARAHHVAPWSVTLSHIGKETDSSELVVRYTREVVTQVLDEYPALTGLGITLGERMGGMTPDQRRDWLDQTFFNGIAQAKRPAKFIYRAPLSANTGSGGTTSEENDRRSRAQIESLTNNIVGPIYVEFKHNWSHAHSTPELFHVHGGPLSDAYWNPKPTRHKVIWTMRNEDLYILRWGQPDFVRAFIQRQEGKDYVGGAVIGSECYIPALDYISKAGAHKNWQYAFERQWLFYTVWGQLLYDAATPDARFEAMFDVRFGKGVGKNLLTAWKLASNVPLHFASFHKGTWDGSLYTEGFSSWIDKDEGGRTFFGIDGFIKHPVLDTKRYVNIADYVKTGRLPEGAMSPIELATKLERESATAMSLVAELRARGGVSPALECELTDIEAWCAYGSYFAEKVRGGVALATARKNSDVTQQRIAIAALERALVYWKHLAERGATFNELPVLSNSRQPFSWASLTPAVEGDIEVAKAPLTSAAP